uniref:Uncharacterized protein n=1 Tax=OCS116 cluster bacterium TaxID=2030921 RepID=A0A2A4Z6F0_9PROT
MSNVVEFKSLARPIAHFVRIDSAYKKMGDLYAADQLPVKRVVFDAARIIKQSELVNAFRNDGVEIVLDTQVAELAAPAKFKTYVKDTPWASAAEKGLLDSTYFDNTISQMDIISWIARFAVENRVDTVLSPTHFLGDRKFDNWMMLDVKSCAALRDALDKEGGQHIAIDYPVIQSLKSFNGLEFRNEMTECIRDLPVENVWIRASGLGNGPKPLVVKQLLSSLYDFQQVNKPIIMDYASGLMGQALVAFGGVSGIAQGIGEREAFNANSWNDLPKARDSDKPFGRRAYVPISGLGRRLSKPELSLLSSAKGGKKYLGCQDSCCQHGVKDMLRDSRQHTVFQAVDPIRELEKIPDFSREGYFIEKPLQNAERLARNIKDLNPSQDEAMKLKVNLESLKDRLSKHHSAIGKFSDVLNIVSDERGAGGQRAMNCSYRTNLSVNSIIRRGQ